MENENTKNINRLLDVEMNITVRFGSTQVPLRDVANFGVGSMIELDRNVDEPVELLVNNALFAQGEVVVVDGYYGVRVTKLVSECEPTADSIIAQAPITEPVQVTPEVTQ